MESRVVIRKKGNYYTAILQRFCGDYFDMHEASGNNPYEAREQLVRSIKASIYNLEDDLYVAMYKATSEER